MGQALQLNYISHDAFRSLIWLNCHTVSWEIKFHWGAWLMEENGGMRHLNYNSYEALWQIRQMKFNVKLKQNVSELKYFGTFCFPEKCSNFDFSSCFEAENNVEISEFLAGQKFWFLTSFSPSGSVIKWDKLFSNTSKLNFDVCAFSVKCVLVLLFGGWVWGVSLNLSYITFLSTLSSLVCVFVILFEVVVLLFTMKY